MIIKRLKVLISEGKVEEVLDILSTDFNLADENEKTLILNKSRFSEIERKKLNNVLTKEDKIQRSKIEENILHLLDEVKPVEMPKETTLTEKQDNKDCNVSKNTRRKRPIFKSSMSGNGCMVSVAFTILLISFLSSCLLSFLNINLKSFKSIFELNPETSFHKTTSSIDQLTIFVTDAIGNAVLEYQGELNIPIGNRILNRPIESKGRTNFAGITANNIGDTITIGLKAEGWELVDKNNKYVFDGKPITIKVKKDSSLGHIKGKVMTRDGQNFIDSAKITINADTVIFSNDNGFFEIMLPENMWVKKVTDRYELTVSKEGYQTLTQLHSTKSAQADIRLVPK